MPKNTKTLLFICIFVYVVYFYIIELIMATKTNTKKIVTARVEPDTLKQIKKHAVKNKRTVSQTVSIILANYFNLK